MNTNLDERRWELFLQLLNKTDLDLKGENISDYKSNFYSAFTKANNIACLYQRLVSGIENRNNGDSKTKTNEE